LDGVVLQVADGTRVRKVHDRALTPLPCPNMVGDADGVHARYINRAAFL
jgi:hypothetical protein